MSNRRSDRYDVIVAGGGSAGVAAAVGASRAGAKTLLIERYGFLGGTATHSNVLAFCGLFDCGNATPRKMVGGVADDILREMTLLGVDVVPRQSPTTGNWVLPINPEALKIALDRTANQAGVDIAFHSTLISAIFEAESIRAVRILDHAGEHEAAAAAFVDASGECNLAHLCGVPPSDRFPVSHVRAPASYPVRISGAASGLTLDRAVIAAALKDIPDALGRATLRRTGSFITRVPGSDDVWWLAVDLVADGLSGFDMGVAERDGRELVWQTVAALRAHAPGFERASVAGTGPQLGIRETRHVKARYDVVQADAATGRRRGDGVARAAGPMEIHHAPGHAEYRPIGGDGFFDIPLDALRAAERRNLWLAGRTIGADPAAFASVRVMGTAFATGHAAGVAATIQAASTDDDSPVAEVRNELSVQGALI